MRNLIRRTLDRVLGPYGYELRRKHSLDRILGTMEFKTVIDGGANIGDYSAKMYSAMPAAEIHAFEPAPALFRVLTERFAHKDRVKCYERALGERSGTASFHVFQDTFSSSLLEEHEDIRGRENLINVEVTTLDAWAGTATIRRPALLKLDLEGNELAALKGAKETLDQIDYIELEITFVRVRHGQPTLKEILIFLDDHGFELVDIFPGIVMESGRCNWADVLFARTTSSLESENSAAR